MVVENNEEAVTTYTSLCSFGQFRGRHSPLWHTLWPRYSFWLPVFIRRCTQPLGWIVLSEENRIMKLQLTKYSSRISSFRLFLSNPKAASFVTCRAIST